VEKPRLSPYLAALALALLALLSKPMAVTLPCTLLLLDFWPLNRWRTAGWPRLFLEKVPFLLLTAGTSWLAMNARRSEAVVTMQTLSLASRISNALVSYVKYLEKIFLPLDLGVFYPHPNHPQPFLATGAALLLLTLTALVVWQRKPRPYLLMGWLWFLGVLVPVIGLTQIGSQAWADRFSYEAQIGIFLAVTWFVTEQWPKSPCTLRFVAGPILFACAVLTSRQVTYWQDGVTLFEHTIAVTQNNACAYANAGLNRARMGDLPRAITHFQASLRIQPDQSTVWREFGVALEQIGKPQDGIRAIRTALQYDPSDLQARYRLALALAGSGATDEAIAQFEQVLGELPHSARTHYYLARALEAKGRHEEALTHLRLAAQLAPERAPVAATLRQAEAGPIKPAAFPEF
jgi:tetratricopeptide (TPR) repeat protein